MSATTTPPAACAEAIARISSGRFDRWSRLGANLCVVLGLVVQVRQDAAPTRTAMGTDLNDTAIVTGAFDAGAAAGVTACPDAGVRQREPGGLRSWLEFAPGIPDERTG